MWCLLIVTFKEGCGYIVGCVAQLVECQSLAGKLSLSWARPAADGWQLLWANCHYRSANQANSAFHFFGVHKWVVSWNQMYATLWCYLVIAMEVTAGLAESNGSLPMGGWLKVTCGLTVCTPGSAPCPALGNECGKTLPYLFCCYMSEDYMQFHSLNIGRSYHLP